jgi:hypothetical protein
MNLERYEFFADRFFQHFEFTSDGPKGKFKKVISFIPSNVDGVTYFNLGFGDWNDQEEDFDDMVVTNNHDTKKVLATIAAVIILFTDRFPDMLIYAQGSTSARTRLYQMGIVEHWQEIDKLVYVYGYKDYEWQPFRKGVNFEAFLVRRK